MGHIQLLCDIAELNHLFHDSISVESFMQETVEMAARHLDADVCSIYTYDDADRLLMLRATRGLSIHAIGDVCMRLGEGLTGKALEARRCMRVEHASEHPQYKYFAGINEEPFESFMAVPIVRGVTRIGVLVLQRRAQRPFTDEDELACKAVASQLANIIENARFLMTRDLTPTCKPPATIGPELRFIKGKTASAGFAHAAARVVDTHRRFGDLLQTAFEPGLSVMDLDAALAATAEQLQQLQEQVEEKLSDAASLIFASHLLILKDKKFIGPMKQLIAEGIPAPRAVLKIAKEYIDAFAATADEYFREKVQDVEDLAVRIVGNLIGHVEELADYHDCIVVARELFPSDLLRMSSENVRGIVLVSGGVTSHLSILARSLQIPMVITNQPALMDMGDNAEILIDADAGNVYVDPTPEIVSRFEERNRAQAAVRASKGGVKPRTLTRDGTEIRLMANINLLSDIAVAQEANCSGVGLYRTEFPFIIRNDFPSEQEQYVSYRRLVEGMAGKPVTFRTLDIGGDKVLSYYQNAREQNPGMGMRSIRFSLENKDVFTKQIRAILRAGAGADIRIMFPMISSVEDFGQARAVVHECAERLAACGVEHNPAPQIGMMVELPSVVSLIDAFATEVDFFSIGTNDFIQFMLGVDRTNEKVERFYIPHHPAVLRGIAGIVAGAARRDKEVSICGDMAQQPAYVPFLIGLGVRTLSMEAAKIPLIQQTVEQIELSQAEALAADVVQQTSAETIGRLLGVDRQKGI
ncbi:MAG: phosphoenolpyruvate--protein phosphotransferase [Phycisphaerae bacterium]|nr:phosphoenolpyruvate--protein phosphotransferase [Phycisphaerae bacterium]